MTQGLDARRAGADARALQLFQQAYSIDHAPRTLAQLGLAEQASLGHWRSADADLRAALAVSNNPWIHLHLDVLTASLAVIEHHIGLLDVSTDAPHAELFINGEHAASLPLAQPLRVEDRLRHRECPATGFHDFERTVEISAGQLARETFRLVRLPNREATSASTVAHVDPARTAVLGAGGTGRRRRRGSLVVRPRRCLLCASSERPRTVHSECHAPMAILFARIA